MRRRHKILIDGRIFSLQTKGGISKMWAYIIASPEWRRRVQTWVLLYPGYHNNVHLKEADIFSGEGAAMAVSCPIPSSDNQAYASRAFSAEREQCIREQIAHNSVSTVFNTYYGENVLGGCRYVVTALDFAHEELPELASKPTTAHVLQQKRLAFENADHISFISNASRLRFFEHYPWFDQGRTGVVHLGHDDSAVAREKISGLMLHVGTRGGYKNFPTVLRGIQVVLERRSSSRFFVLGGETPDAGLTQLQERFPGRVYFEQQPSDKAIDFAMASADVYLSASRYEGFGIPLLDAMRFGTKAVVSDIPPYREIAGDLADYFYPGSSEKLAETALQALDKPASIATVWRPWGCVASDYIRVLEQ